MKCVICGYKKFNKIKKQVRDSVSHSIATCKKCGHTQLCPLPSLSEEIKFYNSNLQSKNISSPNDLEIIRINSRDDIVRRANFVSNYYGAHSRILDIGSGDGFFLQEMNGRGYNITGLEISRERRKTSQKITTVKVLDINLMDKMTIKDFERFDCITLFHVLEHITGPTFFLKNIRKNFMKKNGSIIIEVPNLKDLLLSENREYGEFYWQRAHLSYFDAKSLVKIVRKSGFSIKNICYIQRYGLENFMHWFMIKKPQIGKPSFQTNGGYRWLEDFYKKYLCNTGKSDTLILVAKSKK